MKISSILLNTFRNNSRKFDLPKSIEVIKRLDIRVPYELSTDIDYKESIEYMNSEAYKITYRDLYVWQAYKRNFRGHIVPKTTRKMCIRKGILQTTNPCPLCRDDHLVLHPKNILLLKQFLNEYTGQILPVHILSICRKQYENLKIVMLKAWDMGTLKIKVSYPYFDYSLYQSIPFDYTIHLNSRLKFINENKIKDTT
ncbi:hypothetical protein A3Q56_03254 [Intoshia linei]|uniref:Small ribosomal subunit protein mS40 n=1 Tax=Intoshia linei TaxID=1819745 RepID=A0A177B3Y4_9BILA|nr:hypothetical protein A3Q56_03254 [Intoshia linei]